VQVAGKARAPEPLNLIASPNPLPEPTITRRTWAPFEMSRISFSRLPAAASLLPFLGNHIIPETNAPRYLARCSLRTR
jgi:hypothetical protein